MDGQPIPVSLLQICCSHPKEAGWIPNWGGCWDWRSLTCTREIFSPKHVQIWFERMQGVTNLGLHGDWGHSGIDASEVEAGCFELLTGVIRQNTQSFSWDCPDRRGNRSEEAWKLPIVNTLKMESEFLLQMIRQILRRLLWN